MFRASKKHCQSLRDVIVMYVGTVDGPTTAWRPARVDTRPVMTPPSRAPAEEEEWPLTHSPEAASTARHLTRSVLDAWHVDGEVADSVLLVVSELVTNAVRHAEPPVVLHLHRDARRQVWVMITDGGPATTKGTWAAGCEVDEHGRGLGIVMALAAAHGFYKHPDGEATHWARLPT
ncbi:ATP-binding protein [Streptomyces sp. NPDC051776]|uniref:ATP-binding protein n=1 Tax=Streptomyces sp. NPDC051776 TaxID=3155414 RepID=UPI003444D7F3